MKRRKYELKERAVRQQQTRERIVEAAVALHQEIGPAATTISALAERAGVQRLTVYRHFPSETDILQACSAKWLGRNRPPDVAAIAGGAPAERTRAILLALYSYYRRTQKMWASLYRDLGQVDALEEPMARFEDYLSTVEKTLQAEWSPSRSKKLRATLAHAVQFSTWQSLSEHGLGRAAMADLVCSWIEAAAG